MKISDYCTYAPKSKIKAGDANPNGKYQFYASSPDKSRRCDEYLYDCKAIIMGTGGSATLHYYDGKFSTSTDCLTLIPNENIRAKYLYYFFLANMDVLEAGFKGAGLKHTNKGYIDNIEITKIPSLSSQDKIVNLFDELASIIEKERRQIEKLDDLIKARFVEMFGLPGTDPFEYGKVKLGECCGINPKKAKDTRLADEIEVSFVSMPSVSEKGEIDPSDIRKYEVVKKGFTYFAENDVLFAKITPCMENGKGAVAKGLMNGIGFGSTEFHVLRPIEGLSNSYWIYVITSFKTFRRDAKDNMTGSAGQRRTPASFLESYEVSLPPIELQNQFAAFVAQVDKSKFALVKSIKLLKKSPFDMLLGLL